MTEDGALDVAFRPLKRTPTMPEGQNANNLGPAAAAVGAHTPRGHVYRAAAESQASLRHPSTASADSPGLTKAPLAENGPPNGGHKLDKFAYSFFDPQMAPFRKIVIKILGMVTVLSVIVMWLCLPLYWGSLWKADKYTNKLTVRVIDRDGSTLGASISQGLLAQTNLKYFTTSPSEFPTSDDVAHDIVQEGAWASIVISAGATAALQTARQIGNASYNGSEVVQVYYAQARQETAVGNYLLPHMQIALGQICGQVGAQSNTQYLSQNAGNQTAITLLATAPSTISNPVFYTLNNLRPYNQPVAAAITLVGLIYMLIFAFIITMANNACREIISPFLTTRAYIGYRLMVPMLLYLILSFFFAMINLPFKVHFAAHFTYGGGFFLWWFVLYLGMSSVGLATEFAITILGPKFMAFFLIPLIIVNVSVATNPHELQPWIYRYGLAMPFFNVGRAVRTIIFDTKNELGRNIGILLGWIGLSLVTIPVATWIFRRESVNAHQKAMAETEKDTTTPDGRIV
ncbi:hypothetical protein BCR39DRAFT_564917 [Naematelia encephala]|uniref:DUF3533 domain-containing protein n=1 Tax=Naematelia encephala TaxID=71784 RepID=A0A1Y2B8H4_9TREE|nr:hypothetical protein BCR39DRAFT_564917 [Naematelia encephala]